MTKYLLRRLAYLPFTMLIITIGSFLLLQAVPGGPMSMYTENPQITPADRARLEHQLGLDQPLYVQYGNWLVRVLQGDWGYSLFERRSVLTIIGERVPNTIYLVGLGMLIALTISLVIGTVSAYRQNSTLDHAVTFIALIGYSIPIFWSGLIVIVIFTVWLQLLPAGGMYPLGKEPTFIDRLRHTVLPVSVLSLYLSGYYTRFVRNSVLEVKNQDYIRTARSKGLNEWQVLVRHLAKNAAIPIVTIVTLDLANLFAGALFTETIFTWPGMGRLFWEAATRRDYPLLMALITFTALLVIISNLIADLLYALLNPKIREGMTSDQ